MAFTKKSVSTEISMDLYTGGVSGTRTYDVNSLIDLLEEIPFNKISVPVYCAKSYIFDQDEAKGTVMVGYIKAFDGKRFDMCIYNKNIDKIEKMTNAIVLPKVRVRDDVAEVILSLEIVSE